VDIKIPRGGDTTHTRANKEKENKTKVVANKQTESATKKWVVFPGSVKMFY
jgi:hypothetical protein